MSFRVPELSRAFQNTEMASPAGALYGAFVLPSPEPGWLLMVIADDGTDPMQPGWEHVSVHAENGAGKSRTPTWTEMHFVKMEFWQDEDVVMQLHPRRSQYVNLHKHTLHLWRPLVQAIPEPPAILVGPQS